MDQRSPAPTPANSASRATDSTRLHGHVLLVARTAWVTFFALNLVWFALAIGPQVDTTLHPCLAATCTLTPAQAALFHHLGVGLSTVAMYAVGMPALIVLAALILAVLLFLRRSDDWMVLVVGLFLVCVSVNGFVAGSSSGGVAGPVPLSLLLGWANSIIFYAAVLLFPDGRVVPRWAWVLLAAWALHEAVTAVAMVASPSAVPTWFLLTWGLGYPVLYLSALGVQVYRYRRVSNAKQRQQTKWVIVGFAVAIFGNVMYWIVLGGAVVPFLPPALGGVTLLYYVVAYPLYQLVTIALPISFALAIQRHQLFDVDTLIQRTLVYGSLTLLLAALYFGMVLGAQFVLGTLTGHAGQQPLIIVASTLLIAALFTPLRRGLQATIDRRFYRRKYDATKTLAAFGSQLRTETSLEDLSEQLVVVVRETMQPASVSLWLRPLERTIAVKPSMSSSNGEVR